MNRRFLLLIPFCLTAFGPAAAAQEMPIDFEMPVAVPISPEDAATAAVPAAAAEITPSDVYSQARRVELDVQALMEHMDVPAMAVAEPVKADLLPRHVWQKGYFILTKLAAFRRKNGLPVSTVRSVEPVLELDPAQVFEQTQYILTELTILKRRLGVAGKTPPARPAHNKRPVDVFNLLHQVSLDLETLNREEISPSYVFAEVMRVFEDVNTLLHRLGLEDTTYPPEKLPLVTPLQSQGAAFELLAEVQRLQRDAGIPRTDLSVFRKRDEVLPADVFNLVGMALAEIQPLKARLELQRNITPPAEYYEGKTPADVHQLLIWVTRKLRLIQSL